MPKVRTGRKPKKEEDKVVSRGVYLTKKEWNKIEKKYGSPTNAMRMAALSQCG